MKKGEVIRKGIATLSLIGAIGMGEVAVSYEKASVRISGEISSAQNSHNRVVALESIRTDDNEMVADAAVLGGILLLAAGLSGSELTGEYIVRAVRASREQEIQS